MALRDTAIRFAREFGPSQPTAMLPADVLPFHYRRRMDDAPSVDSGADDESLPSPADNLGTLEHEAAAQAKNSTAKISRTTASALGAQTAFQLDAKTLDLIRQQFQNAKFPMSEALRSVQAVNDSIARTAMPTEALKTIASATAAASAAQLTLPAEVLKAIASVTAAASATKLTLPAEALAQIQATIEAATNSLATRNYWKQLDVNTRLLSESASIPSLYTPSQLALRDQEQDLASRPNRSPEAFFDEYAVVVDDVRSFLKALSAIQEKHHLHRLVWRGQQDATWPVHSSLYRKLEESKAPTEEQLIAAELISMQHAGTWGKGTTPALNFFAGLQHYGAPTRLLDATVDPEIAAWFAVEDDPELNDSDGRVVAWGRDARTSPRKVNKTNDDLPVQEDAPFWHSWTTDEDRGRVGWGTGSRTWSWFPPALSDRMRIQRAGFLIEAGPLITPTVAETLSAGVTQDWRIGEIARATSIIGLPSQHDARTTPNDANLVPIFSLRITSNAKASIREYLESKGLFFSTVYPDQIGLVSYLRGPFGLSSQ